MMHGHTNTKFRGINNYYIDINHVAEKHNPPYRTQYAHNDMPVKPTKFASETYLLKLQRPQNNCPHVCQHSEANIDLQFASGFQRASRVRLRQKIMQVASISYFKTMSLNTFVISKTAKPRTQYTTGFTVTKPSLQVA